MKIKGILVTAATIGAAVALTFGGFALANQGEYVPPTEPAVTSAATPSPSTTPEPTITETPAPTPTETAEPAPTVAPAPAPKQAQAAAPAAPAPVVHDWPKFVPMVPQPATSPMPAGYQVTADGTWFIGCGENDTSCSWTAGPGPAPTPAP